MIAAVRAPIGSTRNVPMCSSSRAVHSTESRAPGCSTGAIRRPAPPRTTPACRPCARVSTSTIAELSPCRRAASRMPSSRQSITAPRD